MAYYKCPCCDKAYSIEKGMEEYFRCPNCGYPDSQSEVVKSETPIVECPYCKSNDTIKITAGEKAFNTFIFGIFGQKRKYQWHCNNCKSDF